VEWSGLTRSVLKARLYERETYFREGLSDAEQVLGPDLDEVLWRSAFLVIKPDGLVAGKLADVLRFLDEHGFTLAGARSLRLRGMRWRELWRYQLTSATLDRLAVNDLVMRCGPALALALRGVRDHEIPATVRLSSLKGSAMTPGMVPGTLRHLLGQPNRVLSFVHVADEPADLVRELGLLFPAPARQRLLERLRAGQPGPADQRALALARDRAPGRQFASAESLTRVAQAVRTVRGAEAQLAADLLGDLDRMSAGQCIQWRPFGRRLAALAVPLDPWDIAVLGTSFIQYDEPGASKVLEGPDLVAWRQ
jgi:nucleoside diphosphate kinase